MVSIANPIYDSVFKYLMQDTLVAKVMIENLIGYEVEEVVVKNNEFVTIDYNELKLTRVDFQAKVKISDTETQLVTIELQKAFLGSEYMRFRRYLGEHYKNNENCVYKTVPVKDKKTGEIYMQTKEYPNPIIQVYLLGHKLAEIDSPISRSQLKFVDLDKKEIVGAENSLFVKSLTHQTIIVQIPRLPHNSKQPLEEMMSIFNYKAILDNEGHIVKIEDFSDKSEQYKLIARRLQEAVADAEVRKRMEEEDDLRREYELWMRNQKLREDAAEARGANNEKLSMARRMKLKQMSLEDIAAITGLPIDEISAL